MIRRLGPLAAMAAIAVPAAAAPASAQVQLAQIGQFDEPTHVAAAPGDTRRVFVVERDGRVQLVKDGVKQAAPFLDIEAEVRDTHYEEGLLSIAFHPTAGTFYVYYTVADGNAERIEEMRPRADDPDRADLATRRTVIDIPHPFASSHNGGQLQFGPDGQLWIGTGDGGGRDDQFQQAQSTTSLLGKLLRIDPRPAGADPYSIPADNPYAAADDGARDEIWASGLRNPWRFAFDSSTGDLAIGDVGQVTREEIDFAPAATGRGRGVNWGWPCWEGTRKNTDTDPQCDPSDDVFPAFDKPQADGWCAIVGGYVVRDGSLGELDGRYLYGDFCQSSLRSVVLGAAGPTDERVEPLTVEKLTSFGVDACGGLYAASRTGDNGVYRLEGPEPSPCAPAPGGQDPPGTGGQQADPDGWPTPDTEPPEVVLRRSRVQRILQNRSVAIGVRCDESCDLTAKGTLSVPGLSRVHRLRTVRKTLAGRARIRVELRVPKSALPALRRALERRRRVSARVTVLARDLARNPMRVRRLSVRARR